MPYSSSQILCVDSSVDSCEVIQMILRQSHADYDITHSTTAEGALNLISQRAFDLYIFGHPWHKPMGLDLCRQIRLNGDNTPVLIFSILSHQSDREDALSAGANEYIVIPNDLDHILRIVERLLNKDLIGERATS